MSALIGGGFAMMPSTAMMVQDEGRDPRWSDRYNWDYQRRFTNAIADQTGWRGLWPSSRMMAGDPTVPLAPLGQDALHAAEFELSMIGFGGSIRPNFINGSTTDSVGNPLGGVVVQGFVTATEAFVGQVSSDSNGNYSLPTINFGVPHYLVAYYPGTPDKAGTTVNTLVPGTTPA